MLIIIMKVDINGLWFCDQKLLEATKHSNDDEEASVASSVPIATGIELKPVSATGCDDKLLHCSCHPSCVALDYVQCVQLSHHILLSDLDGVSLVWRLLIRSHT